MILSNATLTALTFCKFDDVVRTVIHVGRGANMTKQEIRPAFRLVSVRLED